MTEPVASEEAPDTAAQPELADPGSKTQPAEGGVAEAEDEAPDAPATNDEKTSG
jgi:hypothetical protein